MTDAPGQDSGHPFSWADLVDHLVADRGTLTAVAAALAEERGYAEDVETIERGLRRLRKRDGDDGGVWGQRVLRRFGLPVAVTDRVRWMGQYHTRFSDLPVTLGLELLRPFDRPPVSEADARVWVHLGFASLALRQRNPEEAARRLERAASSADPLARVEWLLVESFRISAKLPAPAELLLEEAEVWIERLPDGADRACLQARLVDHRGHTLNVRMRDHEAAYELYDALPEDAPAFARVRKHNGLGWSALKLGRRDEAREHAEASLVHAGDSGRLRLRAMALNLLANVAEGREAMQARARAQRIAAQLEDEALAVRFTPRR